MVFSVVGSLFIEKLRSVYKHYQELAIPIILSGGIGLGVIFISLLMVLIPIYLVIYLAVLVLLVRTDLYHFIISILVILIISLIV